MDSSLDLASGTSAIKSVGSFQVSRDTHISRPQHLRIPTATVQKLLFTSGSREDSDQGTIYVILTSAIGNLVAGSAISFTIRLKTRCEYFNRLAVPSANDTVIYADEGYDNYFTDSSSDVQGGTKLTLKAHEGGAVVPFSNASPEAVYKFSGTKLAYCKATETAATATGLVTHAVPIRNSATGGLFVFDTLDKARAYTKTGDVANCLTYVSPGPYVTPSNPGWILVDAPPVFSNSF